MSIALSNFRRVLGVNNTNFYPVFDIRSDVPSLDASVARISQKRGSDDLFSSSVNLEVDSAQSAEGNLFRYIIVKDYHASECIYSLIGIISY